AQGLRAVSARRPARRRARLGVPGGDADPGADALVHPEDRRDGDRRGARRAVDARRAHRVRARALHQHPAARRPLMTLPEIAGEQIATFVLVLARVGGLFFFAPVFSSKLIPVRAKFIAAGAISIAMTPLAEG